METEMTAKAGSNRKRGWTMKWILVLAIAVVLAFGTAQAAEEKVLFCTDTAANGFVWENGEAKPGRFLENRHIVKVHANGDRTVARDGQSRSFECSTTSSGEVFCNQPLIGSESWVFKDNKFTFAFIFGTPVDGDPNIWVSYGTCVDFE
jgi:hypothetical protein